MTVFHQVKNVEHFVLFFEFHFRASDENLGTKKIKRASIYQIDEREKS